MLEKRLLRLLSVVLFALCFVIPVTAQLIPPGPSDTGLGGVNSITGMVLVSTQRLERRVSIRLRTMTKGDRVVMTDENGNFAFRGLLTGDYTLIIENEKDFEPYSQTVSVIQMRGFPAQNYNVSIRLTPKAGTSSKPGVINSELAGVPRHALDLYNKAIELAQAGDRLAAIEQLKQAISEYPGFMLAFNELGIQYLRLGELNKATESLLSALKIAPEAFTPRLNHGIVLTMLGQFDASVKELSRALKDKEQSAAGHFYLGQALANLGRFGEAEEHLTRALALGGDEMCDAHRFLGAIYASRGDRERAITEFESYLRLAPKANDADQVRQAVRQLKSSSRAQTTPPKTSP